MLYGGIYSLCALRRCYAAGTCARAQGTDEKHLLASLRGVPSNDGAFRACRMGTKRRCGGADENADCGGRGENRRGNPEPRSAQRHHKEQNGSIYMGQSAGAWPFGLGRCGNRGGRRISVSRRRADFGQFTEMQRQNLARYIEENLAIGKEQQTWTNE